MKSVFNEYASKIYAAVDRGDVVEALGQVFEASKRVGIHRKGDGVGTKPDLIWGEYIHLVMGCHKDLYHPKNGYFPVNVEKSVAMRLKGVFLEDIRGDKGERMKELPFKRVSEVILALNAVVEARLDSESKMDLAEMAAERVRKEEEIMRNQGYGLVGDETFGNLFSRISRR